MAGIRMDFSDYHMRIVTEIVKETGSFGLLDAAEHVRGVAAELTPIESGHLVGSAEVKATDEANVEVYYPGPYARYQHFGLDFRHEHGQALYLEQPMATEAEKVFQIIADTIRREGGFGA